VDENTNNDVTDLFLNVIDDLEDTVNLLFQYMYAFVYDKADKYPQINREFARLLCNLVIIQGIIIKFGSPKTIEKIKKLENEIDAEIEEFNENIERFINCFENKDEIDPKAWDLLVEKFCADTKLLILTVEINGKDSYEKIKEELEKYIVLHNRIYNIVEKYKNDETKNIMYFSPEMTEGLWEDKSV